MQADKLTSTGNALHQTGPVKAKDRIDSVDILRGFALLGVLLMNIHAFSGLPNGIMQFDWSHRIDNTILILTNFLAQAKFYSLFSMLFGCFNWDFLKGKCACFV